MRVEIDIDLGPLGDEWEPVAFRKPKCGEWFFDGETVAEACFAFATGAYLIVRRRWKWPEWLKAAWIAMDEDGMWFGYSKEPSKTEVSEFWSFGGCVCNLSMTDFMPPPCTDWTQSKRRNPNHTEPAK